MVKDGVVETRELVGDSRTRSTRSSNIKSTNEKKLKKSVTLNCK